MSGKSGSKPAGKSTGALAFAAAPVRRPPSRYSVPALEKGLDVLEALARDSVPQSLSDLSRALDRTTSELFRVLNALLMRGYVVRDEISGNYALSLKLYELAHVHSPVDQLLKAAEGPMRRLADRVRESCHLSVLNNGRLLVLAQAESPEPLRLSVEVGGRFSALNSTSGRLLLAVLPEGSRGELLEKEPDWLALPKAKQEKLLAELRGIAREGSYVASSATRPGMTDIAVPVGSPRADVVAALCIPCLLGGRDEAGVRKLVEGLRETAEAINRVLGLESRA